MICMGVEAVDGHSHVICMGVEAVGGQSCDLHVLKQWLVTVK